MSQANKVSTLVVLYLSAIVLILFGIIMIIFKTQDMQAWCKLAEAQKLVDGKCNWSASASPEAKRQFGQYSSAWAWVGGIIMIVLGIVALILAIFLSVRKSGIKEAMSAAYGRMARGAGRE